jgi:hypothetical protein
MKTHIPISKDPENWWQKSRLLYLDYFLRKLFFDNKINILEIGPGYGLNIQKLSEYGKVDVVEVEKVFINYLNSKKEIQIRNIFQDIYQINNNQYDFIVLMDVLEHIPDNEVKSFVNKINKLLKVNGYIFVSVPAYQYLFSEMDKKVGHYRRYSWKILREHLINKFEKIDNFGFNYLLLFIRVIQIKFSKNIKTEVEVPTIINKILYNILKIEYLLFFLHLRPKIGLSYFFVGKPN